MAKIKFDLDYWRGYDVRVLHELLEYRPSTGDLIWKPRALKWFTTERIWKMWNTQFAGKIAGCIAPTGYRVIAIFHADHRAHRIIWAMQTGEHLLGSEDEKIDHINQDRADNRWSNLREATNQQNKKNATRQSNNKTGVTGVYRRKQTGKFCAMIKHNGRSIYLGTFTSLEEAAAARKTADIKFGFHDNHGAEKKAA